MDRLISEKEVLDAICHDKCGLSPNRCMSGISGECVQIKPIKAIPSAEPQAGHCKDCKYFEYDSVAKVDGISLIVAHEICNKWGDGCKTKEDGYCFLFEPQEISDRNLKMWEEIYAEEKRREGSEE